MKRGLDRFNQHLEIIAFARARDVYKEYFKGRGDRRHTSLQNSPEGNLLTFVDKKTPRKYNVYGEMEKRRFGARRRQEFLNSLIQCLDKKAAKGFSYHTLRAGSPEHL
jgi:hypothetical protein